MKFRTNNICNPPEFYCGRKDCVTCHDMKFTIGSITFGRTGAEVKTDILRRLDKIAPAMVTVQIPVAVQIPDAQVICQLLRQLEDVLIPLWKGEPVTDDLRHVARGLWERVADMQDALK